MSRNKKCKIISMATETPSNAYQQIDLAVWMHNRLAPEDERLKRIFQVLYKKTKIEKRYSVLGDFNPNSKNPILFKSSISEPKVEERLAIYDKKAINLAKNVALKCLKGFDKQKLTHVITVSCTGMSAPGLETQLKQQLQLNQTVSTNAVNFIGCYAFFPALKMAEAFCKANTDANVLIVAVELCTLHFQNKQTDDHLLSNSLFSDGAAAVLVSNENTFNKKVLSLENTSQLLISKGKNDMAWNINSDGFIMKLSSYIPALVDEGISELIATLLEKQEIKKSEIEHWAIHPGGRKILEVCETELSLADNQLWASFDVLKNYGNMSAPTIVFVLEKLLNSEKTQNNHHLFACGFGPGLTLEAALFKVEN